jgi:hypothetical protein
MKEKTRFKAKNLYRFKNVKSRDFNKNFDAAYLQYVIDVKGKQDKSDETSKDEDDFKGTTGAFITLLADIDDVNGTNETHFMLIVSLLS